MKRSEKRILVVDDEPHILRMLEFLIRDEGYRVYTSENGNSALQMVQEHSMDLVILDLNLPDIDGLKVCSCLGTAGIPTLILSSHDEDDYVVEGLERGALDYVRKPFNHRELILRIENLLERQSLNPSPCFLQSRDISINLNSEEVLCRGKRIHLSPTEYLLLVLLMKQKGSVVSWTEILEAVWDTREWAGAKQLIKVNIRRLRRKIEEDPNNPSLIISQWGRGYRFHEAVLTETDD